MFEEKSRLNTVERFLNAIERWMVVVTFAEAGDTKTALDIANETLSKNRNRSRRRIEKRTENPSVLMA